MVVSDLEEAPESGEASSANAVNDSLHEFALRKDAGVDLDQETMQEADEIVDSDDGERLEELAEEQETSYWTSIDGDVEIVDAAVEIARDSTSIFESSRGIGEEVDHEVHQDESSKAVSTKATIDRSKSPDPMDLLALPQSSSNCPAPLAKSQTAKTVAIVTYSGREESILSTQDAFESIPAAAGLASTHYSAVLDHANAVASTPARVRTMSVSSNELPSISPAFQIRKSASPASSILSTLSHEDEGPTVVTVSAREQISSASKAVRLHTSSTPPTSHNDSTNVAPAPSASPKTSEPPEGPDQGETTGGIGAGWVAGGRSLRKRTAIQLEPYTREFMTFATKAAKNDWQGIIITAGLNKHKERADEDASRSERHKSRSLEPKKRVTDTHGGWLVPDDQEDTQRTPTGLERERWYRSFSAPSSEDGFAPSSSSAGPAVGGQHSGRAETDGLSTSYIPPCFVMLSFIPSKASKSGSDTEGSDLPELESVFGKPRPIQQRPHTFLKSKASKSHPQQQGSKRASTSKFTIDDALAAQETRKKRQKRKENLYIKGDIAAPRRSNIRSVSVPASSPEASTARESLRSLSSSPPPDRIKNLKRKNKNPERHAAEAYLLHPSKAGGNSAQRRPFSIREISDSSSEEEVEDEAAAESFSSQPNGDSPERPEVPEDRFHLNARKKKALRGMMPAIYVKRAQQDLELMREEKKSGKTVRETEVNSTDDEQGERREARAKVRLNGKLADRPIRYIIEDSTSESDEENAPNDVDSDEGEGLQQATATWANHQIKGNQPQHRGGRYWDNVISNILIRDKLERQNGTGHLPAETRKSSSKRQKRKSKTHSGTFPTTHASHSKGEARRAPSTSRQQRLEAFYQPAIQLDDPESLYAALPAKVPLPQIKRKYQSSSHSDVPNTAIVGPRKSIFTNDPTGAERCQDDRSHTAGGISSFSRFTFDYGLKRLSPGLTLAPQSYIGKGYLRELLSFVALPSPDPTIATYSCTPYGIKLDSDMALQDLLSLLPRLCDHIYNEVTSEPPAKGLLSPAGETLRFIGRYLQTTSQRRYQDALIDTSRVQSELEHLETRLDMWLADVSDIFDSQAHRVEILLPFKWYRLELAYRNFVNTPRMELVPQDVETDELRGQLLDRIGELTQALCHVGFNRTFKALKIASESSAHIDDLTCELWTALIHMCSAPSQRNENITPLNHSLLWSLVESHLKHDANQRQLHHILFGEICSFAAVTLSAISQISIHGMTTSNPRLEGHWPLVVDPIERIKPQEFAKTYATMSNTSRTRISRYIWTLFARCLVLAERWQWKLLEQSKLMGKLFDLLNSRELQDLSIDGNASFPPFVSDFREDIKTDVAFDDTVFRLFLRLLAKVSKEADQDGTKKARDLLSRITMRTMPMRERLTYSRTPGPGVIRKPRSVLVNHYSLLVILAAVDPQTSGRRFSRFKALLDFPDADSKARQECLKAICYLGIVYKIKGIELAPLLSWVADLAAFLQQQYVGFAKQRSAYSRPLGDRTNVGSTTSKPLVRDVPSKSTNNLDRYTEEARINREMSEVAVMMGVLLATIQEIMEAKEAGNGLAAFPSLAYLNAAWTHKLLDSPMALDPVVGSQLAKCLHSFLTLRNQAIPLTKPIALGDSQDEFGDFDFDYDDPALSAILGENPASKECKDNIDTIKAEDKALAALIRDHFSASLYRLLSNLNVVSLGQDMGVPDIQDKEGYVGSLVQVWTGMAAVLVQNDMRDWSYYMSEYGKESWQRISDVLARNLVGMHFALGMLTQDKSALKTYRDRCLELLLRTLVSPTLPDGLPRLFSLLLNADPDFFLWRHLPCSTDPLTQTYDIDMSELSQQRSPILLAVFRNFKDIVSGRFNRSEDSEELEDLAQVLAEQRITRQHVYHLLGCMLSSMRDQYDASKQKQANFSNTEKYVHFCRDLVGKMKEEIGLAFVNDRTLPQLRLLAGFLSQTSSIVINVA